MNVYRCYTNRKEEFDTEAEILTKDLNNFVKVSRLSSIKIFNRYDVEGISKEIYEKSKYTIFAQPQIETLYDDCLPETETSKWNLIIESVPGQYDQRAHACAECLQLLDPSKTPPIVKTAKHYVFYGNLSDNDKMLIRDYMINPLESKEALPNKPETLKNEYSEPSAVKSIDGFIKADEKKLHEYSNSYNLAMELPDLLVLQDYFRDTEKRDPTETELRVIDTYWSDHCRHTTFFTHLNNVEIHDPDILSAYQSYLKARSEVYGDSVSDRPQTLMDIATLPAKALRSKGKLTNIDISDEVNACSIHINATINGKPEDWLLMFKNETHNHPTEVEPFGGASTCVGGAIRDPLSGRAYVYQAMRVTGSGDPVTPFKDTLPGKIPQRKLTLTAAAGNSSYGNQIGLAAGHVHEIYHPGYIAKRMELGAVVAAVRADNVVRKRPEPGDKVILLGGRTGRDGVGGATGSSKTQTDMPALSLAAEVQKGNAQEERKMQRLFLDPEVTKMIKKCNDFGAGGVSVAVGELADGIDIDLSLVRLKYEGLNGTEIALSESQERMAIVVSANDVNTFISKAESENLEAYVIAEITKTPRMVMRHNGKVIVDISRQFLSTNGATRHASVKINKSNDTTDKDITICCDKSDFSYTTALKALLGDIRYCSQRGLYEMFDGTAGAASVLMKNGGKTQDSPTQVMAALLPVPVGSQTTTCSVMSFGFNPYLSSENPYIGAKNAVITSVAKLVASGCDPTLTYLSFQEYFESLKNNPLRWGKPMAALLGAFEVQMDLQIAAIGGKDSMSGSFNDIDVPPTLVSFAIAPNDADNVITPEFKEPDNDIVIFNSAKTTSELMSMWKKVRKLIEDKVIISAWAVTDGGILDGIFKMAIGNNIGFKLADNIDPAMLFENCTGAIIAEVNRPVVEAETIGRTMVETEIKLGSEIISLEELKSSWAAGLEDVFPTKTRVTPDDTVSKLNYYDRTTIVAGKKFASPHAFILAVPGTTGEIDMARAVSRAGGNAKTVIVKNMTPSTLSNSIHEIAKAINECQILVLPAALSFGDEPGGAAKYLSTFMRISEIADSIHKLIESNDGLILGIGNGFQALVNTGLLPFGKIIAPDIEYENFSVSDRPTFVANHIGRYQATYINTRVASVNSPWLNLCNVGDIHTLPISHQNGRLILSTDMLKHLVNNGQVATQYTDINGTPSMDTLVNPNGSCSAIEGLLSPDGRIFGKMGHTERYNEFTAKNIYGKKHQPIIESGINYYK